MVEVLSMSVQERAMIGFGDGRTHVFYHFGLEVKSLSTVVHCIRYILFWPSSNVCLSKYENV